ncbi:MAG TPA: DUF4384 domain-containing protein [Xanthobacteraceae bacterium]
MRNLQDVLRCCLAGALAGLLALAGPAAAEDTPAPDEQFERDLTVAQKPIFEIFLLRPPRHIDVDAWVDKPGRVYSIGQPLRVMVHPFQDAYITVVDVGSSGRVAILYPNHFQTGARVRAGSTVSIPLKSAPWQIKVGGPPGIDLIQVIASRHPITLPELNELVRSTADSPTVTLGRSAADVARDLILQLKPEVASGRVPPGFGLRNVLIRIDS